MLIESHRRKKPTCASGDFGRACRTKPQKMRHRNQTSNTMAAACRTFGKETERKRVRIAEGRSAASSTPLLSGCSTHYRAVDLCRLDGLACAKKSVSACMALDRRRKHVLVTNGKVRIVCTLIRYRDKIQNSEQAPRLKAAVACRNWPGDPSH